MNQSVNPCEDFFSYTCGNYNKENPIPDSQIMNDLNRRKEREYELKAKGTLLISNIFKIFSIFSGRAHDKRIEKVE